MFTRDVAAEGRVGDIRIGIANRHAREEIAVMQTFDTRVPADLVEG
jgi:hypothetical protein